MPVIGFLDTRAPDAMTDRDMPHKPRNEKRPIDGRVVRELVVLSSFPALGCGLAAVRSNLLFVGLFGVVSVFAIIEAIRSR
jgi:hypothetical protein